MKNQTYQRLKELFDDYYDDYFEETNVESLKRSIARVSMLKDDEKVILNDEKIQKLERKIFGGKNGNINIFRGIIGFFVGENYERRFEFRARGGKVRDFVDEAVTDVFVGEGEVDLIELYGRINDGGRADVRIVRGEWIEDCGREGRILGRREYIVT